MAASFGFVHDRSADASLAAAVSPVGLAGRAVAVAVAVAEAAPAPPGFLIRTWYEYCVPLEAFVSFLLLAVVLPSEAHPLHWPEAPTRRRHSQSVIDPSAVAIQLSSTRAWAPTAARPVACAGGIVAEPDAAPRVAPPVPDAARSWKDQLVVPVRPVAV